MSVTQPIRNKRELQAFKGFYLVHDHRQHPTDLRNYTLTMLGLNTALRISDILHLTWDDVFNGKKAKDHITVREQKTGKENMILLNAELRRILEKYYRQCHMAGNRCQTAGSPYLFPSPRKADAPLSRFQAYRIIRHAAEELGLEHISCHSLLKTFGYHAWKQGTQPALLMSIFNHSSWSVTVRYLGIAQDEKDQVYASIAL